jgi:xanthosine utilization system XapX-like protein
MSKSPALRRYLKRLAIASATYVLTVFLAMHVFHHGRMSLLPAIALALFPSIPIVAIIAIVGFYLKEEKDEFQRELYIKSLLWGTGATLAITSFWSFLHLFARVPPVDGFHVFLLFWIFVGLSSYPLRRYYGGSGE